MMEFLRTRFLGWARPAYTEPQAYAEACRRAEAARAFLDNQVLVEAYQDQLDRFVDEMLTVPAGAEQAQKVMQLHGQAQALIGLVAKLKSYMAEVEAMDANRKQKAIAASQRKTAA
jgi:hypothetical protein